jgi:hypothetical protein
MQKHSTYHLENKSGKDFQWELGCWEAEACIPPGVLLRYFWGLLVFTEWLYHTYVLLVVSYESMMIVRRMICQPSGYYYQAEVISL